MDHDDPDKPYSPPASPEPSPAPHKPGAGIPVVVTGTVLLTLCGAVTAIVFLLRGPPVPRGEVWLDNRGEHRLTIEVDGQPAGTLEPRSEAGAMRVLPLPYGKHVILAATEGTAKQSRTVEVGNQRLILPLGGEGRYAVVTVQYALPETPTLTDSAKLLPSAEGDTVWRMPLSVGVEQGIDTPFPDKSPRPVLRHVCRVAFEIPQCEGGPKALTAADRYTGTAPGD